jgi:hypothetical protein
MPKRPPRKWFYAMVARLKKEYPTYSNKRIAKIAAGIWHKNIGWIAKARLVKKEHSPSTKSIKQTAHHSPAEWDWEKLGVKVYNVLGEALQEALENENSEIATMFAYTMIHLAQIEQANYFGGSQAGAYNHNTAFELTEQAIKLADDQGVPAWLQKPVEEMRKEIKEYKGE